MKQWKMKSPIGPLYIVASERGLRKIYWDEQDAPMAKTLTDSEPAVEILAKTVEQFEKYFAGELRQFDLPIDVDGTPFQKKVWAALVRIPYGKTLSYGELAAKLGDKNASRAVGTANGKNPVSIVVPCHRVIAADGTLGGYSGGLSIKEQLLKLEGSTKRGS